MPNSSRVLLTGASGFIGTHIHTTLDREGFKVRAVVRPDSRRGSDLASHCEVVTANLDDKQMLAQAVAGVDAIVYCAGTVRGQNYADFEPGNVNGVQSLVRVLESLPTPPALLLISSLAASQPNLSFYARSKAAGEKVLQDCALTRWSILRPPAVYGPGDTEMRGLLNTLRHGIVPRPGSPTQRISLLHVNDLVAAVLAWVSAPSVCAGQTVSIDDGYVTAAGESGYDWDTLARTLHGSSGWQIPIPGALLNLVAQANLLAARILNYAPMLTPGKVRELQHERWLCDNSTFNRLTGWQPGISLADGVSRMFETNATTS